MADKIEYELLVRPRRAAMSVADVTRQGLWLAEDHLLCVENEHYAEYYKRFYYRDIEAITLHKTVVGAVVTSIVGAVAALFLTLLTLALVVGWGRGAVITFSVILAPFAIALLVGLFNGSTCKCTLRTAVHREHLRALSHFRPALKTVRRIREKVDFVQGLLSDEDMAEVNTMIVEHERKVEEQENEKVTSRRSRLKIRSPYNSRVHGMLFSVLLVDFSFTCVQFFFNHSWMYPVSLIVGIACVVLVVIASIKQFGTNLPISTKIITWLSIGYAITYYCVLNIYASFVQMANPGAWGAWGAYLDIYAASPFDSVMRMIMLIVSGVCAGGLGVAGLFTLRRFFATRNLPPPMIVEDSVGE